MACGASEEGEVSVATGSQVQGDEWTRAVAIRCVTCGAARGEGCRKRQGKARVYGVHVLRARHAGVIR
jgi:hypothetical protein